MACTFSTRLNQFPHRSRERAEASRTQGFSDEFVVIAHLIIDEWRFNGDVRFTNEGNLGVGGVGEEDAGNKN